MVAIKTIIIIAIAAIALATLLAFFLGGTSQPINEQRVFAEGCINYCRQIKEESERTGELLDLAAVRKAGELEGSDFMAACAVLHPDTVEHPYLCWNRACCDFQLRAP